MPSWAFLTMEETTLDGEIVFTFLPPHQDEPKILGGYAHTGGGEEKGVRKANHNMLSILLLSYSSRSKG